MLWGANRGKWKRPAAAGSRTQDTSGLSRQRSATEPRQPDNHQPSQSSMYTAQVVLNTSVVHQRYISIFYMFIVQVIRSTVLQSKRAKLFSLMVDLHINKVYKVRLNSCCACPKLSLRNLATHVQCDVSGPTWWVYSTGLTPNIARKKASKVVCFLCLCYWVFFLHKAGKSGGELHFHEQQYLQYQIKLLYNMAEAAPLTSQTYYRKWD